jgi:hypothetical protein
MRDQFCADLEGFFPDLRPNLLRCPRAHFPNTRRLEVQIPRRDALSSPPGPATE